jgi:CheY-like chemotaxis protein
VDKHQANAKGYEINSAKRSYGQPSVHAQHFKPNRHTFATINSERLNFSPESGVPAQLKFVAPLAVEYSGALTLMDVLIVDDSLFSRASVSHFLADHGYQPILCADGAEALERLRSHSAPRLIVCDWVMPKLNGLELCRAVRTTHAFPYVYFILLTSRNYKVDIVAAVNSGVDDCLTKPCDEFNLIARVNVGRRLLEQQDEMSRRLHHSHLLLEQAPFAIACLDEHGKVVDANPAWAGMLGFPSPGELMGCDLGSKCFCSPVDFRALLDEIALSEAFHGVPVALQTRDGQSITPHLWGRPITIDGQRLYHISTDFSLPR